MVSRGISPHIGLFPIENRVEFGDAARVVGFFKIQMAAAVCLAAALAGEPGGCIGECTVQRLDFADVAALPAPLDVFVNRCRAVFALEYGGGFNQRVGKNQNLYGEIMRTACADKVSDNWKANLGWRVSF